MGGVEGKIVAGDGVARMVAVGRFDGVHLGHRHLLAEARRRAPGHCVTAYTFPPRGPSLVTLDAKRRLLHAYADEVIVAEWDGILKKSPETFVVDELAGRLQAAAVAVGPDHRFGRDRTGDVGLLNWLAGSLDLAVEVIDPLCIEGEVVSARRIRDLITAGDVEAAASLLGRPAWIAGMPTPGLKIARQLGYPTVNLNLFPELVRPRPGVYAAWAQWPHGGGKALFYIGDRPTFAGLPPSAEVHLLTPPGDRVTGPVEVHLMGWLRADERFDGARALAVQIGRDQGRGEEILRGTRPPAPLLLDQELRLPRGGA